MKKSKLDENVFAIFSAICTDTDASLKNGGHKMEVIKMSNSNLLYGPSGLEGAFSLRERSIITISFATQHSHDFFSIFSSLFLHAT